MSVPERLTIATCIGCGAMSLPSACPGGCGPERSLDLVAGAELDELVDLREQSRRRAQALAEVLTRFMALPSSQLAEQQRAEARRTLRAHGHDFPAAYAALAAELEPVVSWWCEHCGGLDAPAPCVGVCIRRTAQWATLEARQRQHAAATAALEDEQHLARAVRSLLLTRACPDAEQRHWEALREAASQALAAHAQARLPGPLEGANAASAAGMNESAQTISISRPDQHFCERSLPAARLALTHTSPASRADGLHHRHTTPRIHDDRHALTRSR